jgi:hypothetical protein
MAATTLNVCGEEVGVFSCHTGDVISGILLIVIRYWKLCGSEKSQSCPCLCEDLASRLSRLIRVFFRFRTNTQTIHDVSNGLSDEITNHNPEVNEDMKSRERNE